MFLHIINILLPVDIILLPPGGNPHPGIIHPRHGDEMRLYLAGRGILSLWGTVVHIQPVFSPHKGEIRSYQQNDRNILGSTPKAALSLILSCLKYLLSPSTSIHPAMPK